MAINRPTTKTIISTAGWGIPITDEVNSLRTAVTALQAVVPWTNASMLNGWVTFPSYQSASYRKVGDMVQIRGVIASGTLNADSFYLPAGYRPPFDLLVPQLAGGNTAAVMIVRASTGGVIPQTGPNSWFSISTMFSITP